MTAMNGGRMAFVSGGRAAALALMLAGTSLAGSTAALASQAEDADLLSDLLAVLPPQPAVASTAPAAPAAEPERSQTALPELEAREPPPEETVASGATASSSLRDALRLRFESSGTWHDRRVAFPAPPGRPADYALQSRLVAEGAIPLWTGANFRLNAAFTLRDDGLAPVRLRDNGKLDLREAYLLQQMGSFTFELGRINIRHGTALGFNPTDFFRAQDGDLRPNLDPSEARLNRLGVVAARATALWNGGSASVAFAPKLTRGGRFFQNQPVTGLDLGATNPAERWLLHATQSVAEGVAPHVFLFGDGGRWSGGMGVSAALGDNWLVFGEWSVGRDRTLTDAAFAPFRAANRLDPLLRARYGASGRERTINRVAVGASYTSASNVVTQLEYHFNEAGLTRSGFRRYFDAAQAAFGNERASGQLASILRQSALRQEPMSRHALFARVAASDVAPNLDLAAIGNLSLVDGSGSGQVEARYNLGAATTITARAGVTFGPTRSDFGARSGRMFGTLALEHHF